MKIEIDQSGRIEYTSTQTVIGDSLGNSIFIKSIDKQYLQQIYRSIGRPQLFVFDVFSIMVSFVMAKTYSNENIYIIDREYYGHEAVLRGLIMKNLHKQNIPIKKYQVDFGLIGKKSKAHETVYTRYTLKKKGNIIHAEEILKQIFS